MIDKIDSVIKQIELVMRGGASNQGVDLVKMLKDSYEIFDWYSSAKVGIELIFNEEERLTLYLPLAVKLHNKARNLTSPNHTEVRSVLKAASAWMLQLFGEKTSKVYCIVIRLLCKAGQELNVLHKRHDAALKCCDSAIQLWNNAATSIIQRSLPPVELQDIKIGVFWVYLEKAGILDSLDRRNDDIRKAVSGAMEIMQTLPVQIKYSFAESVGKLGYSAAKKTSSMQDAIHFFKMTLNAIESALLASSSIGATMLGTTNGGEEETKESLSKKEVEIKEVRLKAQLALAFVYMETNQCDKAMSCIHAIQSASSDCAGLMERMAHTIMFAKHKIALKDRDLPCAESSLRALLKLPLTTFDTALNAVKRYMDELSNQRDTTQQQGAGRDAQDCVEFYKLLAAKYPRDPEFTLIRINRLQSMLAGVKTTVDTESLETNGKAVEVVRALVADHSSGERPLSEANHAELRKILTSRLKWHRSMAQWEHVVVWTDALLDLQMAGSGAKTDSSVASDEHSSNLSLIKVDALLNTSRCEEALRLAQSLVNRTRSTTTILAMFRAVLLARKPCSLAVKTLLELQRRGLSGDEHSASALMEDLSRLTLCCSVVQECGGLSALDRDTTIRLLLKEWLSHYAAIRAWRYATRDSSSGVVNGEEGEEETDCYLGVLSNSAHLFLQRVLSRCMMEGVAKEKKVRPIRNDVKKIVVAKKPSVVPSAISSVVVSEPVKVSAELVSVSEEQIMSQRFSAGCVVETASQWQANTPPLPVSPRVSPLMVRPQSASVLPDMASSEHLSPIKSEPVGEDTSLQAGVLKASVKCAMNDIEGEMTEVESCTQPQTCTQIMMSAFGVNEVVMEMDTEQPQHVEEEAEEELEEKDQEDDDCIQFDEENASQESVSSLLDRPFPLSVDPDCDFFSVYGYPDALQQEAASSDHTASGCQYLFRCTLEDLRVELCTPLTTLSSVLAAVKKDGLTLDTLGEESSLAYLLDMALNLGAMLITKNKCVFKPPPSDEVVNSSVYVAKRGDALVLAAQFLEAADLLFDHLASMRGGEEDEMDAKRQCTAMNAAVAARVDAEALFVQQQTSAAHSGFDVSPRHSPLSGLNRSDSPVILSLNLSQALADVCRAEQMVRRHVVFEDRDWRVMRQNSLLLEFHLLLQVCDTTRCEQFISSHQQDLLSLSPADLMRCATAAKSERGGSIEITRSLLTLALQVCNRETRPSHAMMGSLYRQLTELSPSRQLALERVEEFEQLAQSMRQQQQRTVDDEPQGGDNQPIVAPHFDQQDVDAIVSLAFNYGVALLELDQVTLSEKFLAKAIALLQHASPALNGWLGKMQETYALVLRTKTDTANRHRVIGLDVPEDVCNNSKKRTFGGKDGPLNMDMIN